MVEKIIISPESIRGLGNIVMPKTGADFRSVDCTVLVGTDTVNDETVTVFTLESSVTLLSVVLSVDDSSVVVGDTVTLSATVTDEMTQPVEGATVSFKLNGNVLGTSDTNSSGVATYSYTTVSDGTLTFSSVCNNNSSNSVNVTVTVQSYLFYDDVTSDRSSEYSDASLQSSSSSYKNYLAMTYNSNGYYTIQASRNEGNHYAKWITTLNGEDDLKLTCEVNTNTLSDTNRFGLVVGTSDYKSQHFQITNNKVEGATFRSNNYSVIDSQTISSLATNTWYKMEYTVQGTSYTFKLSDMSDNVLYTKTGTFPSNIITSTSTKQYGLYYLNYGSSYQKKFRNIKVEPL